MTTRYLMSIYTGCGCLIHPSQWLMRVSQRFLGNMGTKPKKKFTYDFTCEIPDMELEYLTCEIFICWNRFRKWKKQIVSLFTCELSFFLYDMNRFHIQKFHMWNEDFICMLFAYEISTRKNFISRVKFQFHMRNSRFHMWNWRFTCEIICEIFVRERNAY
jgi:hypothetical protein